MLDSRPANRCARRHCCGSRQPSTNISPHVKHCGGFMNGCSKNVAGSRRKSVRLQKKRPSSSPVVARHAGSLQIALPVVPNDIAGCNFLSSCCNFLYCRFKQKMAATTRPAIHHQNKGRGRVKTFTLLVPSFYVVVCSTAPCQFAARWPPVVAPCRSSCSLLCRWLQFLHCWFEH